MEPTPFYIVVKKIYLDLYIYIYKHKLDVKIDIYSVANMYLFFWLTQIQNSNNNQTPEKKTT